MYYDVLVKCICASLVALRPTLHFRPNISEHKCAAVERRPRTCGGVDDPAVLQFPGQPEFHRPRAAPPRASHKSGGPSAFARAVARDQL